MIEIARRGDIALYLDGDQIVLELGKTVRMMDQASARWLQQAGLPAAFHKLARRPPDPIPGQTQIPAA